MGVAKGTDWVDDLVHFEDGFAVHGFVQILEGLLDFIAIVRAIVFIVCAAQETQDAVRVVAKVDIVFFQAGAQGMYKLIHLHNFLPPLR